MEKTLNIGDMPLDSLIKEINQKSFSVTGLLEDDLLSGKFILTTTPQTIIIKTVRLSDIGISNAASLEEIYNCAQESGLGLCPPNLALYYALSIESSIKEDMIVAMNPITNTETSKSVVLGLTQGFDSTRLGKKFLGSITQHYIKQDTKFSPQEIFIFKV
jgi:hypothetical protein